jgi:putative ABC transport system permease protein
MKGIRRFFRIPGRDGVKHDVDEELRFHLDSRVDDLVRQGMSREAASAQANREFGDVAAARGELATIDRRRVARRARVEWWRDVFQDARIALRGYARRPGFTVVVLLTLALGIGANSAIFSVAESVLLRPLPYRDGDRLVHLWETQRNDPADLTEASYPDYLDWRAATEIFSGVEGYNETNVTVSDASGAARVSGNRVTPGFFRTLGVEPMLGRSFRIEEDTPDGSRVVILGYDYWWRRYGGDRGVLGRSILIDGRPWTIVGVLPRGFRFAPAGDAELWFPLGGSAQTRAERFNHWVNVIARLRDGTTVETARNAMATVMQRLAAQYPETNSGRGALVVPLRDAIVGPVQPMLTVLLGAVAIVLIIACANVASLVLARSIERANEIAVRGALGASRARLLRQLVTENVLLALGGAILGVWVGAQAVKTLLAIAPSTMMDQMPHLHDAGLNGAVLAYTFGIAAMTGIGFGLVPALSVTRSSSTELLRGAGRAGSSRGRQRLRDALVACEIACTLVLIVAATLMGRSMVHLLRVDPGFVAERVVTARIALAGPRYEQGTQQQRFFESLNDRVGALPGVQAVGSITNPPLQGGGTNTFRVEGQPEAPASDRPEATMRGVAGDYFRAMTIRLLDGRTFTARDDSLAAPVIIVNEALARRIAAGRSAVGARLRFYAFPESAWTVIGVVADVKTSSLDAAPPPTIYYTHLQAAENRMSVVAKTANDDGALVAALARVVKEMDPTLPLYSAGTMTEQIGRSSAVFARRYPLLLIGAFAVAALVLAVVGVYGVIAYSVAQRTRELSIRIALGATNGDVVALVLKRGITLTAIGLAAGIPAALILSRSLGALLYGVTAADLTTYVGVTLVLTLIAVAASYLPARRATRVDPAVALRSE